MRRSKVSAKAVKSKKSDGNKRDGSMSLMGHLKELRGRIAVIFVVFIIAFIIGFFFIREIADYFLRMGLVSGFNFVYLAPSELLTAYFGLSVITGLCVSAPIILYESWCFIAPALADRQKQAGYVALFAGFIFFAMGLLFAYVVVLPTMVQFFVNFNTSDYISSSISVGAYLKFVIGILLTFGLIFEMPILSLLLSSLGILKPQYMIKTRMYAVLIIFIIGAIITPPDVLSQIMVALPMIALYQVSIWVSMAVCKYKENKEKRENVDDASASTGN